MVDNSHHLRESRRRASLAARAAALRAIEELEAEGVLVDFGSVSERSGVSPSTLYAHEDIKREIVSRRAEWKGSPRREARVLLPPRSAVSDASLRTDLANAREEVRQLHDELGVLRARLSRTLGAEADAAAGRASASLAGGLEVRSAALERENHDLRGRVGRLEAERDELAASLRTARELNRKLVRERTAELGRERRGTTPG